MTAYGNPNKSKAGLKQGLLNGRITSQLVKETGGIDFGLPVFGYVGVDNKVYGFHNNVATILWDADFVSLNSIVVTVDGTAVTAVVFDTDQATTIAAVAAQIETDIAGATATVTGVREITITLKDGIDRVVSAVVTLGASQAGSTYTYSSSMIFKGFTLCTMTEAAEKEDLDGNILVAATAKYNEKEPANVMEEGEITVTTADAVESNKQAYVVATGANQGKVTDESSGNVILAGATIIETVAAAGLANVRINK